MPVSEVHQNYVKKIIRVFLSITNKIFIFSLLIFLLLYLLESIFSGFISNNFSLNYFLLILVLLGLLSIFNSEESTFHISKLFNLKQIISLSLSFLIVLLPLIFIFSQLITKSTFSQTNQSLEESDQIYEKQIQNNNEEFLEPSSFNLTIQVLNGTTTTGLAAKFANLLKENGFKNVNIGTADNSDYQNTTISFFPEYNRQVNLIVKLLKRDYEQIDLTPPEFSDSADVTIILGSQLQPKEEDFYFFFNE